ncbi:MAG: hypothetical protein EZS28_025703, partial [Streblomastix strix]
QFVLCGILPSPEKKVVILGNQSQLGNWNDQYIESCKLTLKDDSSFESDIFEFPPNETIEFKFIQLDDQPIWESGDNRILVIDRNFHRKGIILIECIWNDICEINITESSLQNNSGNNWELVEDN